MKFAIVIFVAVGLCEASVIPLHHPAALSQYHAQDELGQYSFGYTGQTSAKHEIKTLDGITRGGYSYIDANGLLQSTSYVSDPIHGFRSTSSSFPGSEAIGAIQGFITSAAAPIIEAATPVFAPIQGLAPAFGGLTPQGGAGKAPEAAPKPEASSETSAAPESPAEEPAAPETPSETPEAAPETAAPAEAETPAVAETPAETSNAETPAPETPAPETPAETETPASGADMPANLASDAAPTFDTEDSVAVEAAVRSGPIEDDSSAEAAPQVPEASLPGPIPVPVEETPEVAQARMAHLAAIEEVKARNERINARPVVTKTVVSSPAVLPAGVLSGAPALVAPRAPLVLPAPSLVAATSGIVPGPLPLAPIGISSQYHSQDELGQYTFGYTGGPSAKHEIKTFDGITRGGYSYLDAHGLLQSAAYVSDPVHGFRVAATNLPIQGGPVYIPDSPDVALAKAKLLEAQAHHVAQL